MAALPTDFQAKDVAAMVPPVRSMIVWRHPARHQFADTVRSPPYVVGTQPHADRRPHGRIVLPFGSDVDSQNLESVRVSRQ